MKIADLPLPEHIVQQLVTIEPFEFLNPPQQAAIEAGLFEKKNFLIAIPTASGKTFIAELCALQHILIFKKQVIYLTPLKALALEKYHDFKRFNSLGISSGITIGDFDSQDSTLDQYDLIVSTNEKIDSLLRHNTKPFVDQISLLIIDECHLIDDSTRGPTLETLIVKIKRINPSIQILALSATVQNAEELASWLQAILIQSTWRSVPVEEYFCNQDGIIIHKKNKSERNIGKANILEILASETLKTNGQVLIFANSRKNAQSISLSLQNLTKSFLSRSETNSINSSIKTLIKKDQSGDRTSDLLLDLLKNGIAFHHAGLSSNQRGIVESLFKQRNIKVIVATPTLAAGINLPARRVIIPSIWRFSSISGNMIPIKVMEYEQMRGRSGRPKYDTFGESFILSSSERDEDVVLTKYFLSEGSENIESKLSAKPILRIHLLGVLATGIVKTYGELKNFLEDTFFGFQYNNFSLLEKNLRDVISDLEGFGFIKVKSESIAVTRIGRRVSQLYIDPVTANIILNALIKSLSSPEFKPMMFLHLYCLVPDITRIHLKKKDWGKIDTLYEDFKENLLSDPQIIWNFDYERDIEAFKTALIIQDWISEKPLPEILAKYELALGDFQRLHDTIIWISYSAKELVKELNHILKEKDLTDFIYIESLLKFSYHDLHALQKYVSGIEIRISEGIKDDLLNIINLKGLGRVKARILAFNNINSVEKLKNTSVEELISLPGFGKKLVTSIKEQIGQNILVDINSNYQLITNNFNLKKDKVNAKKKFSSLIDFVKE
jgi:helicase